jgi:predicted amidohydrolase
MVVDRDGSIMGFQDKVQIDQTEESTYTPGTGRRVFPRRRFDLRDCDLPRRLAISRDGSLVGATRSTRGHPHFHEAEPGSFRPTAFADPANTFHEKAALCRAAENTCYFATVNFASPGSPTTSAIIHPDGTLLAYQPYGQEGLLIADIDIGTTTRLRALRLNLSP